MVYFYYIGGSLIQTLAMQEQDFTNSYLQEIKYLLEAKEYELALTIIEKALQFSNQKEGKGEMVSLLQSKIEVLFGLFRFEECLKELENFHLLLKETSVWDVELQNYCFNKTGEVYYYQSSYDKALQEYESALVLQKNSSAISSINALQTLIGIGLVYNRSLKSQKKAIHFLEKALSLAQQEKLPKFLPDIYNGLAVSHDILTNLDRAIDYHQLAIDADIAANGEPTMAMLYISLSQTYSSKVDRGKSILYLHKALEIVKNRGEEQRDSGAEAYAFLGKEYIFQGKFEEGIQYCHQALMICTQLFGENHESVAYILGVLGGAYLRQEKFMQALEYLQKGVSIHTATFGENHRQSGIFYYEIGMCLLEQKSVEEALLYFFKALKIFQEDPYLHQNQSGVVNSYIGECYLSKGDYDRALSYFQASLISLIENYTDANIYSLPFLSDCGADRELLQTFINKATTFFEKYQFQSRDLKDLKAAYDTCIHSFFVADLLRQRYTSDNSHLFLSRSISEFYHKNIDICKCLYDETQQTDYLKECFTLSEQQKAHLLRIAMKDVEAKSKGKIPLPLLEKERDLKKTITQLKDSILRLENQIPSIEKDRQELISLNGKLFDLDLQYQYLVKELENKYPEYYQWKYNDFTASVEEIQAYLWQKNRQVNTSKNTLEKPANHLLVSYLIGKSEIYIFELSAMSYQMHKIHKPANFEQLILGFNAAINTVEIEEYMEAGIELHNLLIAPLQLQEKQRTQTLSLIVLRHDALHYLPFDALFFPIEVKNSETSMMDFHDLDYLVYHFDISYHYSGTLLLNAEKKQAETQKQEASFLGFAPVSFEGDKGYRELEMETHQGDNKVFRGRTSEGELLEDLPNTAIEVNDIYQLFHQKKLAAKAFLFGAASKQNLFEEAPKHKYVLIATHGFQYDESGNLSGIYLAKEEVMTYGKGESREEKGQRGKLKMRGKKLKKNATQPKTQKMGERSNAILTTSESYLLSLQADLVVLSSCSSGIGRWQKGEGLMALHRGFLYAGASNIVFTQFDIPDEMSSTLVKKLFEFILQGNSYTHSLRKAKTYILQEEGVSPQDWAAFALIGY